ncbi:PTS lactose/cellobiose transporter subunit IIA [Terrisporobacter mayombei]|nr:PTS lactose/cellobiose transporter subunit IIA [Terrisporobacter mayombei]
MEEIVLGIIIHAGNAKSKLYEALSSAKEKDFEKAEELLEEANQEILNAHKIQTNLIQGEAAGNKPEISMLLIHSQDHLMTCMSERNLIKEIIDLRKEMNK